ncbi:hypothetical protein [Luteolibacter soli]|uniref:DUF4229 domain-containing protein n=1 Tax=Luteolibacter soli TaxID=3135280 RepID=A0ABU9AN70_9BACT
MIQLRYTTWRRLMRLGTGLLVFYFVGGFYFGEKSWVWVFDVLFWVVVVGSIVFNLAVQLLKKAGLLEFTYTEKDRASYLYNVEKLHQQMTENRRERRRE